MICCKKRSSAAICQVCGKPMSSADSRGLSALLARREKQQRSILRGWERQAEEGGEDCAVSQVAKLKLSLEETESWITYILELGKATGKVMT